MNVKTTAYIAAFGRVLIAAIFLFSGYNKLFAAAATQESIAAVGLPFPLLAYWVALVIELIGGAFLVLGYQTRLTALVIAIYTLVAAAFFHSNFADTNQMINFMKNIAISGGLLQIVAFGAGPLSLDAYRSRRSG